MSSAWRIQWQLPCSTCNAPVAAKALAGSARCAAGHEVVLDASGWVAAARAGLERTGGALSCPACLREVRTGAVGPEGLSCGRCAHRWKARLASPLERTLLPGVSWLLEAPGGDCHALVDREALSRASRKVRTPGR